MLDSTRFACQVSSRFFRFSNSPIRFVRRIARAPFLALAAACLLAASSSARAATFTVTDTSDDASDSGSLRYAMNHLDPGSAATSNTIRFAASLNGQTIVVGSRLQPIGNYGVTLQGPGAGLLTIAGNGSDVVFVFNGSSIYFYGLTVTGGNNCNAGGIQNLNSNVTVDSSVFYGNSAPAGNGGAISSDGTLIVLNSTFYNNSTAGNGPNGCPGDGIGGAINSNMGGTLTVVNSTFFGNSSGAGGAISVVQGSSATIVNSTIFGNASLSAEAQSNGAVAGGIYNDGSARVTVTNSIVSGNTGPAGGDDIDGSGYTNGGGNIVGYLGGAAVNSDAIHLAPLGNYGGLTQTMLPQAGSPAVCAGSASLALDQNGIPLTTDQRGWPMTPSTCPAGMVDAGAVQSNYLTVNTLVDTLNTGDPLSCTDGLGSSCSLRDALAQANTLGQADVDFAPSLFVSGSPAVATPGTIPLGTVTGTLPAGTTATDTPLPQISGTLNLIGPGANLLTVSGNHDGNVGSVLTVAQGGVANIFNLTIANGTASFYGGGLLSIGTVTLAGCAFTGNHSSVNGGAIGNLGTMMLTGCAFSGNSAAVNGGGILNYGTGTLTVSDSAFSGNSAAVNGGGGIFSDGVLTAINSSFSGNSASGGLGGGIYVDDGSAVVSNNTLSGNTAAMQGGGIFNLGSLTLTNSIVAGNTTAGSVGGDCGRCGTQSGPNLIGLPSGVTSASQILGSLAYSPANAAAPTMMPLPDAGGTLGIVCQGSAAQLPAGVTTDARGFPMNPACPSGAIDLGAAQTNYTDVQFVQQPTNALVNQPIAPAPAVEIVETNANTGASDGVSGIPVTLAFSGGSSEIVTPGNLSATTAPTATSNGMLGLATFSGLAVNTSNTSATPSPVYTFTVASPAIGGTPAVSAPFDVDAPVVTQLGFVTPPPATIAAGQSPGIVTVQEESVSGVPLLTSSGDAITLTVSVTGGATVQTLTATTSGGVASFSPNALTLAGSYSYSAAFTNNPTIGTATPAPETVIGGTPASLTASGGTPQSAQAMTPFATPLTVTVLDIYGNPVAGQTVTFTAPGTGASASLSAPAATNAFGQASVIATANWTAGGYTVTAALGGLTAGFSLTNQTGPNLVVTTAQDDAGAASNCTVQAAPGTGTDGACSLRDALLEAASLGGASITFDATQFATAQTIPLTTGVTLSIPSGTAIVGPTTGSGATLTDLVTVAGSYGSTSDFTVNSGVTSAAIANLTIENGSAESGAGINNSGTLTVDNCTFASNNAYLNGGAIYNAGTLAVNNSMFTNNSANSTNDNGGAIENDGTLTVSGSTFSSNSSFSGGAIENEGTLTMVNSTFAGNMSFYGGAIYNDGTLTTANSTIFGNSSFYGAGIFSYYQLTANNTIFSSNLAWAEGDAIAVYGGSSSSSNNVYFGNVGGGGDCLGCDSNTNAIDVDPMLQPLGNYGGPLQTLIPLPGSAAICAGSAPLAVDGNGNGLATDQRGFARTTSYGSGNAAITCVDAGAVQTHYTAVQFANAPSGGYSGWVDQILNPAPIVSITENGQNLGGVPIPLVFTGAGNAWGVGTVTTVAGTGAIFSSLSVDTPNANDVLSVNLPLTAAGSTATLPPLTASVNLNVVMPATVQVTVGTSPAGLAFSVNGAPYTSAQTLTWNTSSPYTLATTASQAGAGVQYSFVNWSDGTTNLTDMVTATPATTSYTANFSLQYQLNVSSNNTAYGTVTAPASGGYYAAGTPVTLTATPAAGYYLTGWTGSNDIANPASASTTITMNGPETVMANFAPAPNYVVTTNQDVTDSTPDCASGSGNTCSLRDALALANTAGAGNITFSPAAFAATNSTAQNTITLTQGSLAIPSNTAIVGPTTGSGATLTDLVTVAGGNSLNGFSVFTVNNGTIIVVSANRAAVAGGTPSNAFSDSPGNAGVTGAVIANLAIVNGGGSAGGAINNAGALTVRNCTFSNNSTSYGGAIFNAYAGTLTVANSIFSSNSAGSGSGIYNGGIATVANSTISGGSGTAIENAGTMTVTNSTFSTNVSDAGWGGAIENDGTLVVTNSTFFGNFGIGAGVLSYGQLTANNNIFSDNFSWDVGGAIATFEGTLSSSNNVFFGNSSPGGGGDCFECTSNNSIDADPMLAPLGNYGGPIQTMIPLPGSAAICAGSAPLAVDGNGNALATDQRGFARITNYGSGNAATTCVDAGAVQTDYTAVQFANAPSGGYLGVINQAVNPAPIVTVTENGQNMGGVPIPLVFTGLGNASGVGTATTVAGTGATFSGLSVDTANTSDVLSVSLPLTAAGSSATLPPLTASANLNIMPTTVQVSVGTLPAGLAFSVDGTAYTAAQMLTWNSLSAHTLATVASQTGAGAQYSFVNWSDGTTSLTDTVTATNVTTGYTANFSAQYQLNVAPNNTAYGTVSPASGAYYAAGTQVTLMATPSRGYYFTGWTGSNDIANAASASTTITINGPETVTANFAAIPNYVVTTNQDVTDPMADCASGSGNTCSLRDALALASAAGAGNITFSPVTFAATNSTAQNTIALTQGSLLILSNTSIVGPTAGSGAHATNLVTVAGGGPSSDFSVFLSFSQTGSIIANLNIANGNSPSYGGGAIENFNTLTVTNTVFSNNSAPSSLLNGGFAYGGAIYNYGALAVNNGTFSANSASAGGGAICNNGTLTLNGTTFSGNSSGYGANSEFTFGGAIVSFGPLTVIDSTFSANSVNGTYGIGGAIIAIGGTLTVNGSTIAGNTASGWAGGIYAYNPLTIANSIVTGNSFGSTPDDLEALDPNSQNGYTDGGGNIVGYLNGAQNYAATVNLAPLGNYGGATKTMIPPPGSAAICAGTAAPQGGLTLPATDQRGFARTTSYSSGQTSTTCVDAGAVQTNYALSFITEPLASAFANQSLPVAPVVQLTENGNLATGVATSVVLSGSPVALSGTTTANLSSGTASFGNVSVASVSSSEYLTASMAVTSTLNVSAVSTAMDVLLPSPPALAFFFGAQQIPAGGSTSLTFTVSNSNPLPIDGVSFTDVLPADLAVSTPNGLTGACPGVVSAPAGGNSIGLAGTTLAANGSCSFTVNVTATAAGHATNTATPSSTNAGTGQPFSASLGVYTATATSLTATRGASQSAYVGNAFAIPLQATLLDQNGNPIPGVTIAFTAPASGASATFTSGAGTITAQTDANGIASAPAMANTTAGSYSVTATVGSLAASFALTNQPPPNLVVTTPQDDAGAASNCTVQTTPGAGRDGACSLRDALLEATDLGAGNITFDATKFASAQTIALSSGVTLSIPSNTAITGPRTGSGATAANLVTVAGGGPSSNFPVFTVNPSVTGAAIANLTIENGYFYSVGGISNAGSLTVTGSTFTGNSGWAGGIYSTGNLTVNSSSFSDNDADYVGGVSNQGGTATIANSTFASNQGYSAGAIQNDMGGTMTVTNSTIAGNSSTNWGGILNGATLILANSIVSGNTGFNGPDDLDNQGSYTDNGGNVVGYIFGAQNNAAVVNLAPLANYGGATQTMIPLPGSAAICAGLLANIPSGATTDQRGQSNTNASYAGYGSNSPCVDAGAVQTHYSLSFTTEPQPISPAPAILPLAKFQAAVTLSESGSVFTAASVPLPLSLAGSGTLSGGSASTANGVATFTGLEVSMAGAGDQLTANLTLNSGSTPVAAASASSSSFSVEQVTPTIVFQPLQAAQVYGAAIPAGALNATATYNGQSVAGSFAYTAMVNGNPLTLAAGATVLPAGRYSITASFTPTDGATYAAAQATVSYSVTAAALTITPVSQSKSYGATLALTAFTTSGLQNSDTVTGATLTSPGTAASAAVGSYPITASNAVGTGLSNYSIAYATGSTVTVNAAALTITPTSQSKPYGATLVLLAFTTSGLQNSDTVTGATLTSPGTAASAAVGSYPITASNAVGTGLSNYSIAYATGSTVTVNAAALTITPANQSKSYGSTLALTTFATSELQNSDTVTGVTLASAGTAASAAVGSYPIIASNAVGTGLSNYSITYATGSTVTVNAATLTITANNASRTYGTANPAFAGTVVGAVNGDSFTESFTTNAVLSSNAGNYAIVPSVAGANLADYQQASTNGTLAVSQAASSTALSVSSASITPGQSVTLTAQASSTTTGTPTGMVSFYDGTSLLGTAPLNAGAAVYSTAALAPGLTHNLGATYGGDINFTPSSAPANTTVSVAPLDFTMTIAGPNSATLIPGSVITYQVTVTPDYGSYAGVVNFTVSGLPPGATATFSPSSIAANGGAQTVTVTIETAPLTAMRHMPSAPSAGSRMAPVALAFLLLIGAGGLRRNGRKLRRMACVALLLLGGAASIVVSGCGGGFYTQSPKSYTVTITAACGSLEHSATVTLNVQ
jgi:hypothetical protein